MSSLTEHATLRRSLLRRFAPVAGQTTVGIAVSGGADSLALMLLANEWARHHRDRVRLIVYSVDHGLRREAASEVAFVVREATRLGLEARALCWTGEKPKAGVQAAARSARYRLIAEAMRADGANILLTAHHQHDQAETVLMRLAHGSGLEGLRGMDNIAEMEGLTVFRPLLDVPPAALKALVEEAGLVPVADPSNADRHYERVRWRQVLPKLADLGLDGGQIAQFARRAGEADLALGQWAAACFAGLVAVDPLGAAQLPFADFSALPAAVGIRLLARLLEFSGGGQKPRALGAVERLHQRLLGGAPPAGSTVLGTSVRRRGEVLWFSREAGRGAVAPTMVHPAETLLWDRRFRIVNHSSTPFCVRMATGFSRRQAEQLVGGAVVAPASAIRSAPLVSTPDGAVLALGCYRLCDTVDVELTEAGRRNAGREALLPQT